MALRQVKNRDRSTLRRAGPCFQCGEQTIYGDGAGRRLCPIHVQFGDPWLDQAFANGFTSPARTAANQKGRGRGYPTPAEYPRSFRKPYLCARCRGELEAREQAEADEWRREREVEAARQKFEKTWRSPKPGEFPIQNGERRFLVVRAGYGYEEVRFLFRTSRRWCVGSRPVFVCAMYVADRRVARTYHVGGVTTDPVAVCFAVWFQNQFQETLARSEHASVVWRAAEPHWRDVSCSRGYNREGPNWVLIHTVWTDGSVQAAVEDMVTYFDVQDFAKKVLDADVIDLKAGRKADASPADT